MMLHHFLDNDQPWFAPKRFGYGAGLPMAWQGWVMMVLHIALIVAATLALAPHSPTGAAALALILGIAPMPIYARRTRGGWRWRWGGD